MRLKNPISLGGNNIYDWHRLEPGQPHRAPKNKREHNIAEGIIQSHCRTDCAYHQSVCLMLYTNLTIPIFTVKCNPVHQARHFMRFASDTIVCTIILLIIRYYNGHLNLSNSSNFAGLVLIQFLPNHIHFHWRGESVKQERHLWKWLRSGKLWIQTSLTKFVEFAKFRSF